MRLGTYYCPFSQPQVPAYSISTEEERGAGYCFFLLRFCPLHCDASDVYCCCCSWLLLFLSLDCDASVRVCLLYTSPSPRDRQQQQHLDQKMKRTRTLLQPLAGMCFSNTHPVLTAAQSTTLTEATQSKGQKKKQPRTTAAIDVRSIAV